MHSTHEYALSHLVGEQLDDEPLVREQMTRGLLDAFARGAGVDARETARGQLAHASVMAWDHAQVRECVNTPLIRVVLKALVINSNK